MIRLEQSLIAKTKTEKSTLPSRRLKLASFRQNGSGRWANWTMVSWSTVRFSKILVYRVYVKIQLIIANSIISART
jgi:hypothetical protein